MRKSRINRRTVKRQNRKRRNNRSSKKNKQRGGKIVLPMRYFTKNFNKHYYENPLNPSDQNAHSHGVTKKGNLFSAPDLKIRGPMKQSGGAVSLPMEYFNGNNTGGRYFEAGSPELENCTSAYGRIIPNSHGVVMDPPNNNWMSPNLAGVVVSS